MSNSLSMSVANLGLMRAFDEIAKAAGVTYKEVVRSEAAKILEAASKNTAAAQVKLIEENAKAAAWRKLSNGKTYKMSWKMPDAVWLLVQKQIAASIKRRKAARGLAKKSWKQVADDLGLSIAVPSYVEAATTPKGDYPEDGKATEESRVKPARSGLPRCKRLIAWRCSDCDVFIERTMLSLSAIEAHCGISAEKWRPGIFVGVLPNGPPPGRPGFGSQVSNWLGAPHSQRRMQRFSARFASSARAGL